MCPLTIKPMFATAGWRHPKTRDGRLTIFIVFPTGALDQENGIQAELETAERLVITFSWPPYFLMLKKSCQQFARFAQNLMMGRDPSLPRGYEISLIRFNRKRDKMYIQNVWLLYRTQSNRISPKMYWNLMAMILLLYTCYGSKHSSRSSAWKRSDQLSELLEKTLKVSKLIQLLVPKTLEHWVTIPSLLQAQLLLRWTKNSSTNCYRYSIENREINAVSISFCTLDNWFFYWNGATSLYLR